MPCSAIRWRPAWIATRALNPVIPRERKELMRKLSGYVLLEPIPPSAPVDL